MIIPNNKCVHVYLNRVFASLSKSDLDCGVVGLCNVVIALCFSGITAGVRRMNLNYTIFSP
jgi:hypothetical protein